MKKIFTIIGKSIRNAMCRHGLHIGDQWVKVPSHQSSYLRQDEFRARCTCCGVVMSETVG